MKVGLELNKNLVEVDEQRLKMRTQNGCTSTLRPTRISRTPQTLPTGKGFVRTGIFRVRDSLEVMLSSRETLLYTNRTLSL